MFLIIGLVAAVLVFFALASVAIGLLGAYDYPTPPHYVYQQRLEEQARQERIAAREGRVVAQERALKLLTEHLDRFQRRDLVTFGWFKLLAQDGLLYTVKVGFGDYNVVRQSDGMEFCTHIHPLLRPNIPVYDEILAQVLMLKTDIGQFKRIAHTFSSH